MAYRFTARAVPGVFERHLGKNYETLAGSFTIVAWPDGTSRFGAPTEIAWLSDIDRLPDVVNLPYLCVSVRVRDVIERIEPGRHNFYPVRITMKNGTSEQRYLLHVTQSFDAVSAEHSTWIEKAGLWERPPSRDKRLVFDARLIGTAHLWRNHGLGADMNFMASDELAAAARSACFTGLLLDAYEQTDRDGHYAPSPLPDRVYVVSQQTRLRPSGYVPLLVKVKLLDGRPKDVHFADDPGGISMTLAVAVEQGRPLDPAGVPTRVSYYQESKGNAPDLFSHADLPLTVSERLKQLIEEIEPGIHQFLPISFEDKKGAVTEERHLLVLGTVLDAGSPQHSTMLNGARWNNPGREQGAVLIDRAVVAGRHAWRDRRLPGALFVSDRIAGIIEERGWPHLRFGGYDLAG